jgi:hypothetical protein
MANSPQPSPAATERISQYLSQIAPHVHVNRFLGGGTDGDVWETTRNTALKLLQYEKGYYNERDSYLRLQEYGITQKIAGFWIPSIVSYCDESLVVEMDMMQAPPYVIDFAKVRIDRPPEFSEQTVRDFEQQGVEHFEHHWPEVKVLLNHLESFQIYYLDPKRGNITFPDMR